MKAFRSTATSLFSALVFMAGTVAIPTAHLAFHSLPHDHTAGGLVYQLAEGSARHMGDFHPAVHHHDSLGNDAVAEQAGPQDRHTHPVDDDGTDETKPPAHHHERQPFDPHHGEGSASHFAVAVSDAPADAVVLLLSSDIASAPPVAMVARHPRLERSSPQLDRGPPLLALL